MSAEQRNLDFLKEIVGKLWKVIVEAELHAQALFPELRDKRYPNLPEKLTFIHAEELLKMYPDVPRKQRETAILQECPPSSSSALAIHSTTAILTKCAPPITTIGLRKPSISMARLTTA
jgi:hypothetical protein